MSFQNTYAALERLPSCWARNAAILRRRMENPLVVWGLWISDLWNEKYVCDSQTSVFGYSYILQVQEVTPRLSLAPVSDRVSCYVPAHCEKGKGHPFMMSANFLGNLDPPPPFVRISHNLSVLFVHKISQFSNPPPPFSADVINGWPLCGHPKVNGHEDKFDSSHS